MSAPPRWLTRAKDVIAASSPIRVGDGVHLLEMAVVAFEKAEADRAELADEVSATLAMVERTFGDRDKAPKVLDAVAALTMVKTLRERLEAKQ